MPCGVFSMACADRGLLFNLPCFGTGVPDDCKNGHAQAGVWTEARSRYLGEAPFAAVTVAVAAYIAVVVRNDSRSKEAAP